MKFNYIKNMLLIVLILIIGVTSFPITSMAAEENYLSENGVSYVQDNADTYASVRTHYQETPFAGSSGEYTSVLSSYRSNMYEKQTWAALSATACGALIGSLCPLAGKAFGIAATIISLIPVNETRLYYEVTKYARANATAVDRNENQKQVTKFYSDSSYSRCIATDTVYIQNIYW